MGQAILEFNQSGKASPIAALVYNKMDSILAPSSISDQESSGAIHFLYLYNSQAYNRDYTLAYEFTEVLIVNAFVIPSSGGIIQGIYFAAPSFRDQYGNETYSMLLNASNSYAYLTFFGYSGSLTPYVSMSPASRSITISGGIHYYFAII